MNKSFVCAVLGATVAFSASAEIFTWTGKNGSLSGNWSDTACWLGGAKPDVTAEDSTISGNRYSAIYLPRSDQDYTITLDEDAFVTNCYLQVMVGSGTGGTITVTGHGKKLATRPAKGPGVNSLCRDNATLKFVDVDAELRGCNALGGEIIVGDGASFTTGGYSLYCDTDNSRFTVEAGGDAQVSAVDNRGHSNVITVNGGALNVEWNPVVLSKGSQLIVNSGTFTASSVQFKSYDATTGRPDGAKFEVNGGSATISSLSFTESSTNSLFAVNGGVTDVSALSIAAPNEIRVTGGTLLSSKLDMPAFANVTFTGGMWTLEKRNSELLTYEDHPLLPQGDGVLNAQTDSSAFLFGYGMSLLASERGNKVDPGVFMTNVLFSGTIQVTNRNARTDFYTRGGDAVITVGNRGKLIVPAWTGRMKGTSDESSWHHRFDLDLFALTYGCHAAAYYIVNDFVNGVTIGANGDWNNEYVALSDGERSSSNICQFKFNDYVTFDTLDFFNKTDTHQIGIYKAQFNNVTNLTAKGGGEVTLITLAGKANNIGEMDVHEGTTLNLPGAISLSATTTNILSANLVTAEKVALGPDAKLSLNSTISTLHADEFVADETSEVNINCPLEMTSGSIKPRIKSKTLGQHPQITVTGPYAAGWSAKNVAGVIYLADGTTPTLPAGSKPYTWSGAVSGNFSDGGNWFGGAAPSSTTASTNEFVFNGIRNTVVTNDMTSGTSQWLSIFNLQFANGCGPIEVHGNALALNPSGYGGATSAIYDESDWPVAIYCDLLRPNAKFGLHNAGSSTLHIMGDLNIGTGETANIYTRGDIRLGGTITAGSIIYFAKSASENDLRIISGGSVTLSRPDVTKQANQSESIGVATLTVDEGGSFTTQGDVYDPGRAQLTHVINGTVSLLGGLAPTSRDQRFTGTGRLVCGASFPTTNASARVVTLGGGLTFVPTGDWQTLSASNLLNPLVLKVEGELTIEANADWIYGASEVGLGSVPENRALVAGAGSTLTVAATDYFTRFADPLVSEGTVIFEDGAKVEPAGNLYSTVWKTFAQAKEFVGLPTPTSPNGKFRIVEGDGCRLLQFKGRGGCMLFIR